MWSFLHFGSDAGLMFRPQHVPDELDHFLSFFPVADLNSIPLRFSPLCSHTPSQSLPGFALTPE